ncbi:ABC transporter permease [Paenibacillus glufosinatiresistens]|uniref:ABC transporter permease n=1 Tax=Paenibacillus glufosinatiresistens TaxID=3070657 RepID=UPI00286E8CA5|nr:ABC transporter permease [Paenibacillus sp. YX.27]
MNIFKRFVTDIKSSRYVLSNFVNQELTVKYKRSALGFFWSLLNPVATMIVSSVVFGSIMRFELKDFVVFLYAGLLPWNFFAVTLDFSGVSILNNEGFIKKIYLPKVLFPFSIACAQFINMLFSMAALFFFMVILGAKISTALFFLPFAFMLIFVFTVGLSLILATINVYFRDMRYIMGVIMNAWYYLTPILYPIDRIPSYLKPVFYLNPCYYLVEMFRAPIYRGKFPDPQFILVATSVSIFFFVMGLFFFYRKERDFVYRL